MKRSFLLSALIPALPLAALLSMAIGSANIPLDRIFGGLFGYLGAAYFDICKSLVCFSPCGV